MRWWASRFRRHQAERELDAELRAHLEDLAADLRREGFSAEEARRRAAIEFGTMASIKEECRETGRGAWLVQLGRDSRYAIRSMSRLPGFTAIAILVIALGIGVNTAMFSVVDAVLLRPLPLPHPEQLAVIWKGPRGARATSGIAPANALELPRLLGAEHETAPFTLTSVVMAIESEGEQLTAMRVGAGFFHTLGVKPRLGRDFSRDDDAEGAAAVAIISTSLWHRRFGGDSSILGRSITFNDRQWVVVGVLPDDFRFPELFGEALVPEVWMPLRFAPEEAATRGAGYMFALLRRPPGASWKRVQGELDAVSMTFARNEPRSYTEHHLTAVPFRDQVVRDVRQSLLIIWAAVVAVLLIVCANIANLLLSRSAARARELSVRASLGASRSRLVGQLLTESLVLSAVGGVVGLLLAVAGIRVLRPALAAVLPRADLVGVDLRALGFTALAAILTGALCGTLPALQLSRGRPAEAIRLATRTETGTAASRRLRRALGIGQIAVAFFLVTGAGLLIRSFVAVGRVDLGFEAGHLLTLEVPLPAARYNTERAAQLFDDLTERLEHVRGVISAGAMSQLPLGASDFGWTFLVRDRPLAETATLPYADVRVVGHSAFRALAIPLRRGRVFVPTDRAGSTPVAVINESLASSIWPQEDPIGKQIKLAGDLTLFPWMTVVGVVGDVRFGAPDVEPRPAIYRPQAQHRWLGMSVAVRTEGDPLRLAGPIRDVVHAVDPAVPVLKVRAFSEYLTDAVARRRLLMWLLTVFSGLALVLALVGIYGLMAYSVTVRAREIGLRLALGERRPRIVWLVVREALLMTIAGLGLGGAAAVATGRAMRSMIYGVAAIDPPTYLAVALLVLTTALVASAMPARRAAAVDPAAALKSV